MVEFGRNNVLVLSRYLVQVMEPEPLNALGVDVARFKVIAIKSRVHFQNDAIAAALGEGWAGVAKGCSTYIAITAGTDARSRPFVEAGRELFNRRQGQLDLSCAQCHDDNWGKRLAGSVVPQAHPTGYPEYRLEWQNIGSLQRRLRICMTGVRAEPYEYGAPEAVALELYLMERARGMPTETPAVRP